MLLQYTTRRGRKEEVEEVLKTNQLLNTVNYGTASPNKLQSSYSGY